MDLQQVVTKDEVENRIGVVKFSHFCSTKSEIKMRQEIYKFLTPIRSMYDTSQHMYPVDRLFCYCEQFKEVPEGNRVPEYEITVYSENGVAYSITVKEIENER